MLLAIDIGNTNTVVGVFEGDALRGHFRVASALNLTSDEAGLFLTGLLERLSIPVPEIDRVIIASVVPLLSPVYVSTSERYFQCKPVKVSARIKLPVTVKIDEPDQVGADRLANAAAGYVLHGGPVIVVDFGTAINFDIVDGDGAYIGGVLCPGPETSMADLARRAARLFEVSIEPPDAVVGRSTAKALKSGFFHGLVGQVDHILDKIIEETGFDSPVVLATGGLASQIEGHSKFIRRIEPTLTLEGLRLIADLNQPG